MKLNEVEIECLNSTHMAREREGINSKQNCCKRMKHPSTRREREKEEDREGESEMAMERGERERARKTDRQTE